MFMEKNFFKLNYIGTIRKFLPIIAIITAIPTNGLALEVMFKPSVGVDIGSRIMKFQDLYGKDHFSNHYYHVSPYIQAQLSEYIAIQAGLEYSDTRKVLKQYADDEPVLGNIQYTAIGDTNTLNFSRIKGEFIGLNFNSNVLSKRYNLPIMLSAFIGISMMKLYSSFVDVTQANLQDQDTSLNSLTMRINSSKKTIPKLGLQLKYTPTKYNMLSFKLGYFWQKTSLMPSLKMDNRIDHVNTMRNFLIKPKSSSLLMAGFTYAII